MSLVVTTEQIAGFHIARMVGFVSASNPVPLGPYHAGIKNLATGRTVERERLIAVVERARDAAINEVWMRARRMGANGVVGLRFADRQVTNAWYEVMAYGTAVYVEVAEPVTPLEPVTDPGLGLAP